MGQPGRVGLFRLDHDGRLLTTLAVRFGAHASRPDSLAEAARNKAQQPCKCNKAHAKEELEMEELHDGVDENGNG